MGSISEKTLIPIGIALAVFGGGAGWMTKVQMEIAAHAESLRGYVADQKQIDARVNAIGSNIESQLSIIKQELAEIKGELRRIKK